MTEELNIVAKGESLRLVGKNSVQEAYVGCGWDVNEGASSQDFDLDVSLISRDASGKALEACYYGNPTVSWAQHSGDNLTGEGEGDDEQIQIDLSKVPSNVAFIDVVVHVYDGKSKNQHFGMVDEAFARLVNKANDAEVAHVDITKHEDSWEMTGLWLVRIDVQRAPEFINVSKFDAAYDTLNSFKNMVLPSHE